MPLLISNENNKSPKSSEAPSFSLNIGTRTRLKFSTKSSQEAFVPAVLSLIVASGHHMHFVNVSPFFLLFSFCTTPPPPPTSRNRRSFPSLRSLPQLATFAISLPLSQTEFSLRTPVPVPADTFAHVNIQNTASDFRNLISTLKKGLDLNSRNKSGKLMDRKMEF